jgi:hypothetical protein
MDAKALLAALAFFAFASAEPADADHKGGTPEQQRDCMSDAMAFCSQHIFAPDRDDKIGLCLWQHRTQISRACFAHLRAPRR